MTIRLDRRVFRSSAVVLVSRRPAFCVPMLSLASKHFPIDEAAPAVPDPVPAPVTPAPTTPAPVVPTCSTWKCPAGSVVPKSKLELPDPDDATCCDKKLCRDFECHFSAS